MKITDVSTIPLRGATHDTGWPGGTDPNEQMNTLLQIRTDEGLVGLGSCFTSRALVEASLTLLRPMLVGETGLEPERVAETLRQRTFWQGRGGPVEHAISGIDLALWDLCGKALGQPVSRLLGGNYRDRVKPYASILFDDPPVLRDRLLVQVSRGFRAIKMGWRPFGRVSRKLDEQDPRNTRSRRQNSPDGGASLVPGDEKRALDCLGCAWRGRDLFNTLPNPRTQSVNASFGL
jgi:L-alanine-DL-glutamate epimerase-like enolase superfamily enzyme